MISTEEAKYIVHTQSHVLDSRNMSLAETMGHALSSDVYSPVNLPSFRQSSMDGYATRWEDRDKELIIQDELPAGTPRQITLLPDSAVKVFTGGPIPTEADMVVPKEQVTVLQQFIRINSLTAQPGDHVRIPGSDTRKDQLAIPKGTIITPMHLGYLVGMGITTLPVIRKPAIAIIITGNEVVPPGIPLQPGQIYESNSFSLKALLAEMGITAIQTSYAKDDLTETKEKIALAITENDMVLITGGVSVGDHDHVANACLEVGVKQYFHGVKQKPGKPLFFGKKNDALIFGLPGNPSSVLSCFYQYVLPALCKMSGMPQPVPLHARLREAFEKKSPLTFFMKGKYENEMATILPGQASFQLNAFVQANCWIELEENNSRFNEGDDVIIHPFK